MDRFVILSVFIVLRYFVCLVCQSGAFFDVNGCTMIFADCNLLDLHTIGGLYTFRRSVQLAGHVWKKN